MKFMHANDGNHASQHHTSLHLSVPVTKKLVCRTIHCVTYEFLLVPIESPICLALWLIYIKLHEHLMSRTSLTIMDNGNNRINIFLEDLWFAPMCYELLVIYQQCLRGAEWQPLQKGTEHGYANV